MHDRLNREEIIQMARDLYGGAPITIRLLQTARPLICPFEDIIQWVPERGRILDIGCGAGLFLGLAASARPELLALGFDIKAGVIAEAQAMARRRTIDDRIIFESYDVNDPYPAGPFAAVSMIDVLHHIPEAEQRGVVTNASSLLSPGGTIIYKDMAEKPVLSALWNRFHDLVMARQWINYRPIDEVEEWLVEDGVKIIARSAKSTGPYRHEWLIGRRPA